MSIKHLSPSTVQSYRTCGKQVYFRKVLGIENPQQYAMTVYGSAMHKAIEMLYKDKLSEEQYIAVFVKEFTDTCDTITSWKGDTKDWLIYQGTAACKDFYKNIFGKYKIEQVEQEYNIPRGDDHYPILCYADAVTSDGTIIDYKFGRGLTGMADSKSYTCNMVTYAWAYELTHGKLPKKVIFIKEKWKYHMEPGTHRRIYEHVGFVIDEMPVEESTLEFYKDVFDNVEFGIKANVWLPAPDDSFFCKNCGYRISGLCKKK